MSEIDPLKVADELERISGDGLSGDLHASGWGVLAAHEAEESVRQGAATIRQLHAALQAAGNLAKASTNMQDEIGKLNDELAAENADLRELVKLLTIEVELTAKIGRGVPITDNTLAVKELKKKLGIV